MERIKKIGAVIPVTPDAAPSGRARTGLAHASFRSTVRRIRVATYNVHGCIGADQRFDVARVAGVLEEVGADVYLLQEVGDHVGREPTLDQARALADAHRLESVVGYTLPTGSWGYGNVVLVRGRIDDATRFDLSVDGFEPRGCLRVTATLEVGVCVTVVAVHLGLAWGERRRQIDQLLGDCGPVEAPRASGDPLVLGGDFNDWPPGPTTRLLGRAFVDAAFPTLDFRGTFPARFPMFRLDRLYSSPDLDVIRYHVHRSPLARVASDHLPVVADYEIDLHSSGV
jgi:endonuclease/exonuclease/phosphatase family metal-dependent hydrolase